MNDRDRTHRVQELIEEYNRRLMATYQRQTATPAPADEAFRQQYPLPDVPRDMAAMAAASAEAPLTKTAPPEPSVSPEDNRPLYPTENIPPADSPAPAPFVGYLRVFVFTGQRTEPLPGARVVITRKQGETDALYANTITDLDGQTPAIPLPSVDPALTLRPEAATPYIAYDIRVTVNGFSTAIYEDVPVYGGSFVTQPAAMLPLRPGEDPTVPLIYYSGGPADL